MKLSINQVRNLTKQLKDQNDLIVSLQKKIEILTAYIGIHEQHFEILDSYKFFKVTDLLDMGIKSKKREAVVLEFPAVADVEKLKQENDFLKQENEKRKSEIVDNVLDDDRQDEIARQIAAKGDRVYAELSQTANNAQVAANAANTAANTAQTTANQAKTAAEKGINDAAVANGMATKAHQTAESVQNDLAALDEVVEYNFAGLQTKGIMSPAPAPAVTKVLASFEAWDVKVSAPEVTVSVENGSGKQTAALKNDDTVILAEGLIQYIDGFITVMNRYDGESTVTVTPV